MWSGPFLTINRGTLFSNTGDQSDLHVIIFDEIDAICKVEFFFLK